MDKFTNKVGKFEVRKYTDKSKNDIYNLIKENIDILIDGSTGYMERNTDISLDGLDELTEVFYNYVQQEKAKHEVLTLEKIKLNAAIGTFNIKSINDHIDSLNEKFNIK